MSQPTSNYGHVYALRDKRNGSRVAKSVRGDPFASQGWNLLGGRCYVLFQFEANTGGAERLSIPVYEDGFVFLPRLSFQKRFQQLDSLRLER